MLSIFITSIKNFIMAIILFKLICSIILIIAYFLIKKFYQAQTGNTKLFGFNLSIHAIFLLSRLSFFATIFLIGNVEPTSDLAFYWWQGHKVLQGKTVYNEIFSSYSLFFPYIVAGLIKIYDSAKLFIFVNIFIEWLSFYTWQKIALHYFDKPFINQVSLVYTFSAIPFLNTTLLGQNQIWLSLFIAWAYLLLLEKKAVQAGVALAVGFMCTKVLILVAAPLLFGISKQRWIFTGVVVVLVVTYVIIPLAYHVNIFFPIQKESQGFTNGNLWYLLNWSGQRPDKWIMMAQTLVLLTLLSGTILCFFYKVYQNYPTKDWSYYFIPTFALLFLIILLFSKKSYLNYMTIIAFPFLLHYLSTKQKTLHLLLFFAFNCLYAVQPSIWFKTLIAYSKKISIVNFFTSPSITLATQLSVVGIELITMTFYAYFLWCMVQRNLVGQHLPKGEYTAKNF